jgi:hypothetical protein
MTEIAEALRGNFVAEFMAKRGAVMVLEVAI